MSRLHSLESLAQLGVLAALQAGAVVRGTSTRRWRTAALHLGAVTVVVAGCDPSPPTADPETAFPQWSLGEATARFGGAGSVGNWDFTSVSEAVALGDDTILVIDVQRRSTDVLLLDAVSGGIRQVGRQGEGPGEYRLVSAIGTLGEEVWIADPQTRRLQFLNRNGSFLSARPLPMWTVRHGNQVSRVSPRGLVAGGAMVIYAVNPEPPPDAPVAPPHGSVGILGLIDSGSIVRDTLTWLAQAPAWFTMDAGPVIYFPGPNHFSDAPLWRAAPDGSGVFVVDRALPRPGEPARYRITGWGPDAHRTLEAEIAYEPQRVPQAILDSVIEVFAEDMAAVEGSLEDARKMLRDSLPEPLFHPPVMDLVIGTDGAIWLAREGLVSVGGDRRRYDVLDSAGRPAGSLTLLRPGRLVGATSRVIWVVEIDTDDAPMVVSYPIIRERQR